MHRSPWAAIFAASLLAIGTAAAGDDGPPPSIPPKVQPYQKAPHPPAPHPMNEIGGIVSGPDGAAVANASVRLVQEPDPRVFTLGPAGPPPPPAKPVELTTDATGSFLLKGLESSSYAIRITAKGFAPYTQSKVSHGTKLEISLERGVSLSGTVTDLFTKAPVAGAVVVARSSVDASFGEEASVRATTGKNGRFVLADLAAGTVALEAKAAGYLPGLSRSISVPPPAPEGGEPVRGVELTVDPGAVLTVRLVDAANAPVRALDAAMTTQGEPDETAVDRDVIVPKANGRFTLHPLPPGTVALRLAPAGFADVVRDNVKLERGKTNDLGTIVVRPGLALSGRVRDPSGNGIAGASVSASWEESGARRSKRASASADGRYTLIVPAGTQVDRVEARARGFAPAVRVGGLPKDAILDLDLSPGGRIQGRVRFLEAHFADSARAVAHPESEGGHDEDPASSVGPAGHFALDDLAAGVYTVEIVVEGKVRAKRTGVRVDAGAAADVGSMTLDE